MLRPSQTINHERRWAKIKADPEKYRALLDYQNERRKTHPRNPESLNQYKKELREVARDIGNCPQCFHTKDKDEKHALCAKCREYSRNYYKKKKEELKKKNG